MKRIANLLLLCIMLLVCSIAVAEEFTLHNGTTFGMSKQEVQQIEAAKGFSLEVDGYHGYLHGTGRIAGIDNTGLTYHFENDALYHMEYSFKASSYADAVDNFTAVENGLTSKYGTTKYSSISGMAFPSFADELPFEGVSIRTATGGRDELRHDYTHRLITLSNGKHIFIQHYIWEMRSLNGMSLGVTSHLDYILLDEASSTALLAELNQQEDDL